MNYIFTKHIFPIQEKIILSKELDYELDNPRTEEELALTKKILFLSLTKNPFQKYHSPFYSRTEEIDALREHIQTVDSYAKQICKKYPDSIDFLSRSWVILRYKYDSSNNFNKRRIKKKQIVESHGLNYIPNSTPQDRAIEKAYVFFNIISHLLENDDFSDIKPFLFEYKYVNERYLDSIKEFSTVISTQAFSHSIRAKEYSHIYTFDEIIEKIINTTNKIDVFIKTEGEHFLFVGKLLDIANSNKTDTMIQFTTLVSIIELLVTHNPDYNRFNIEDSISKQFILKTSILIYQNNKNETLEELKTNLKLVYNIRSKIVHGDFLSLNKIFEKNSDEEDLYFFLFLWVLKLRKYINTLLFAFLEDHKYVSFIKNN